MMSLCKSSSYLQDYISTNIGECFILKELLNKKAPLGIWRTKLELRLKLRGWTNYFSLAIPEKWMHEVDAWIRRKIRALLWKQWKTAQKRQLECQKRWSKAPKIGDFAYSSNRI